MFERYSQPVISTRAFMRRVIRHGGLVAAFFVFSLGIGVVGYRALAHLSWIDSFLNASMILTGMGPVNPMPSTAAKVFAGLYALYSGVGFLTAMGFLFAPILHRYLHKFHLGR